jgi:hypothetical protein
MEIINDCLRADRDFVEVHNHDLIRELLIGLK